MTDQQWRQCEHVSCHIAWSYVECRACGAALVSGPDWGIAARMWHPSLAEAKFYRDNGRYSEQVTPPPSQGEKGEG
jgi:hypothetical protein